MPERIGHIYAIKCLANGRCYIGSSIEVDRRFYLHKRDLDAGVHHSPRLQAAWVKYGASGFSFDIVEQVDDVLFLLPREQFWMWRNEGVLLNCAETAYSPAGSKRSKEQRKAHSEKMKSLWSDPELRAKFENAHRANRGRVQSPEEREMRSKALKGKNTAAKSEAHRAALRAAWVRRKARAA